MFSDSLSLAEKLSKMERLKQVTDKLTFDNGWLMKLL